MGKELEKYGLSMATSAGSGLVGGLVGQIFAGANDRRQLNQDRKLKQQQMLFDKEMTDYNYGKQLQMWKDTNYGAQVEQMEKAGINPGLLYGMSGGGGTTVGSGGGAHVGGGGAPAGGGEAIGMGLQMMQMQLMKAQAEKLEAETKNIGADTGLKGAQTGNVTEDTKGKWLNNEFLDKSLNDRLDTINSEALIAVENLMQEQTQTGLDRATVIQKAELIKQDAIGAGLRNMLIEAQTQSTNQSVEESKKKVELMDADIKQMSEQIAQGWDNLDRQERDLQLRTWVEDLKGKYPGMWNVFGRMLNDAANGLGRMAGIKPDNIAPNTKKK